MAPGSPWERSSASGHWAVERLYFRCQFHRLTPGRTTMPRKAKATEPEAKPVEAAPEAPRGAKTAAVKEAVKAHRKKSPKEIAELLKAQGVEVTPAYVSNIKFQLGIKASGRRRPLHRLPKPPPRLPCPRTRCRWACCRRRRSWRRSSATSRKPRRRWTRWRRFSTETAMADQPVQAIGCERGWLAVSSALDNQLDVPAASNSSTEARQESLLIRRTQIGRRRPVSPQARIRLSASPQDERCCDSCPAS